MLFPYLQFSPIWMASSLYILSIPNFNCALSFAGGNASIPSLEMSWINQKNQNTSRGQGALSDDWAGLI